MIYKTLLSTLLIVNCAMSEVIELTDSNFDSQIAEYKAALVMFYAPWCGYCKSLKPQFDSAAGELHDNEQSIKLIKVDCTGDGKETCNAFSISGYPTLKVFRDGKLTKDYKGERTKHDIVKYMIKELGPGADDLPTKEVMDQFLNEPHLAVIGFFDSDNDYKSAFLSAANNLKDVIRFGITNLMDVGKGVKLFQPHHLRNTFEPEVIEYEGNVSSDDIEKWISKNRHGLVGHRHTGNHQEFNLPLIVAYYNVDYSKNVKGTNYWRNRILKVAQKYQDHFNFAISSRADFRQELSEFGHAFFHSDKPVITARTGDDKYSMQKEFSTEAFEEFVEALKSGQLEPYIKSEEETIQEGTLIKAVGKNFDKLVTESGNDTFITFSATWCGHCKKLAPIWDELADKMKDEYVDIVYFNAADNDFPSYFHIDGYPTLFWLPSSNKKDPERYKGPRDLDHFIRFIASSARNELQGYNRDGIQKVNTLSKEEL